MALLRLLLCQIRVGCRPRADYKEGCLHAVLLQNGEDLCSIGSVWAIIEGQGDGRPTGSAEIDFRGRDRLYTCRGIARRRCWSWGRCRPLRWRWGRVAVVLAGGVGVAVVQVGVARGLVVAVRPGVGVSMPLPDVPPQPNSSKSPTTLMRSHPAGRLFRYCMDKLS